MLSQTTAVFVSTKIEKKRLKICVFHKLQDLFVKGKIYSPSLSKMVKFGFIELKLNTNL